jgi:hypothetical protein
MPADASDAGRLLLAATLLVAGASKLFKPLSRRMVVGTTI